MLEKIVLDYLNTALTAQNVKAYMEVPTTPPAKFIVIEKTAESEENKIHFGTLAIQTYGSTLYEAANLAETVKTAMASITTLNTIFKCTLNASYNFTDTATKRYRYQTVFNFVF